MWFEWFVGVALVILAALLISILYLLTRPKPETELQSLLHSPHQKGQLGESIVRLALSKLPKGIVFEQWTHPDMRGTPDFAIKLGDRYLIIDAKFGSVKNENNYFVERGLGMTKYIVPGLTYPFVLMWIPDPAYYDLEEGKYRALFHQNILIVNTASLNVIVLLIEHIERTITLGMKHYDAGKAIKDAEVRLSNTAKNTLTVANKAYKHVNNAMLNIKVVRDDLERMSNKQISDEQE